jgi:ubiquinone biosynthesis protein
VTAQDLDIGSFSDDPPWLLDPDALTWRRDLDPVRAATRAQVPELTRRRAVPPVGRVLITGARLGLALGGWYLRERRSGDPSTSRAGLSRRLRIAFE